MIFSLEIGTAHRNNNNAGDCRLGMAALFRGHGGKNTKGQFLLRFSQSVDGGSLASVILVVQTVAPNAIVAPAQMRKLVDVPSLPPSSKRCSNSAVAYTVHSERASTKSLS